MDLRDKLRRFVSQKTACREPIQSNQEELASVLGGSERENEFGTCHVIEHVYDKSHLHGNHRLGQALDVDLDTVVFLTKDQTLASLDLGSVLFIDTETTGLAGGTGTYAFLIGIGRFVDERFVVKQFLMRDYHEELAQLSFLLRECDSATGLVSFNGKRFDWPLLQDRLVLARMIYPHYTHHLDLLHPARRLWKDRLASCSLGSLEEHILQVQRHGDVPGYEVPQRFFDYLRLGQAELLDDVVRHNQLDILSLVSLLTALVARGQLSAKDCACPWEAESIARLRAQEKDWSTAVEFYQAGLKLCANSDQRIRLLQQLALTYRRGGWLLQAVGVWTELAQHTDDVNAYEELAKYCEHTRKDLPSAKSLASKALDLAVRSCPTRVAQLQHRLARLDRKMMERSHASQTGV